MGQDAWEEIDVVRAGDNLGWNHREGRHCFAPKIGCRVEGLVEPLHEYDHDVGHSITGGVVPTGKAAFAGRYLFADFVSGRFFAMAENGAVEPLGKPGAVMPSTFGRDAAGNAYVADFGKGMVLLVTSAR